MPKSWRISGPYLTDEERKQALAPGGLSGQQVDTSKLLGKPARQTGERVFKLNPIFAALQSKQIYAGTVPIEEVARRRKANRHARRARRGNVAAIAREARSNRTGRGPRFGADTFPVSTFLSGGAR